MIKNRNELEALAAWGENPTQIAGLEFNQGNWHRFQDDCNTAACMIGTLRYLCPSTTLEPSDTFHQCVEFDMGEIAEHFGVTEPVAEYMFGIDYNRKPLTFIEWAAKDERYIFELEENPEEIQPQMVAERISEVLALQPV